MATRSTAAKSSGKTSSNRTGTSGKRSRSSSRHNHGSLFLAVWAGLTGLYGGRVILAVTGASLVVSIEALLFKANYQSFFRLVGIELLLVLLAGWIFYMVQSSQIE
ncbi:MAG: hypothetical protein EOM70_07315 [Clostridia bacterium]|nr:hypothetical protein [Clostridia bacterium]